MLPWHPLKTHKESWSLQEVKSRCFNFSAGPAMLPDLVPLLKRNDPVPAKNKGLFPHLFLIKSFPSVYQGALFSNHSSDDSKQPDVSQKGSGQNCGRAWRSRGKLGSDWSSNFFDPKILEAGIWPFRFRFFSPKKLKNPFQMVYKP